MRKVVILLCLVQLLFTGFAQAKPGKDREYWVKTMIKIIDPLYTNLRSEERRVGKEWQYQKECNTFGSFRAFL